MCYYCGEVYRKGEEGSHDPLPERELDPAQENITPIKLDPPPSAKSIFNRSKI